jgi:hypothetical protein
MVDALTKHFSNVLPEERFVRSRNPLLCSGLIHIRRGNIRVLVPGAGLGRLAYDIAKLGNPNHPTALSPLL